MNASKSRYASFSQLQAAAIYIIGRNTSVLIFERMKMIPGRCTHKGCETINQSFKDITKPEVLIK